MEGDGGRVVVQLVEIDGELADGVDDDGQCQGGDVGIEEAVEATADAVVVSPKTSVIYRGPGSAAREKLENPRGSWKNAG
jgi:hypothetical protein